MCNSAEKERNETPPALTKAVPSLAVPISTPTMTCSYAHKRSPGVVVYVYQQLLLLVVPLAQLLLLTAPGGIALDNGLARLPPMGWMSWQRFACIIDCENYPDDCISEQLFKDMADHLVADNYTAVGYNYINIDDCWPEKDRHPKTEQLVADRKRFPNGIKALADYIHSKGLKAGIYGDIGTLTCGGYPGFSRPDTELVNYFFLDSETFAEWGIDSIKVDGCYASTDAFQRLYPRLGAALNLTCKFLKYQ